MTIVMLMIPTVNILILHWFWLKESQDRLIKIQEGSVKKYENSFVYSVPRKVYWFQIFFEISFIDKNL